MKNPNGYGCVYKLSGKRRKPFGVRVTIGWDENGKQLYRNLGYYEDRKIAMRALAEFNTNPYSVEASTVTFAELYEKMMQLGKFQKLSRSSINAYNAAYTASHSLHNMKFVDIKTAHMQNVIDSCGKGHGTLRKIRTLFNQLFQFAMENDIVNKDYSDYVNIGKNTEGSSRVPFTAKEIERLFQVLNEIEWVDTVLIMIYTGLRIGELLTIRNEYINLENETITGGIKTDAGKDRLIPINKKILPLIKNRISDCEYLITNHEKRQMSYFNYYEEKWKPVMEQLGMNHKPHDCRHTFATLMNNANANNTAIKKLIGHSSFETTEKVYTHKDIEELRKAINSI